MLTIPKCGDCDVPRKLVTVEPINTCYELLTVKCPRCNFELKFIEAKEAGWGAQEPVHRPARNRGCYQGADKRRKKRARSLNS